MTQDVAEEEVKHDNQVCLADDMFLELLGQQKPLLDGKVSVMAF